MSVHDVPSAEPSSSKELGPEQVAEVRQAVTAECSTAMTDSDVRRFIRAENGDLVKAADRLQATHSWRMENGVDDAVCKACLSNPRSHYMHVVGHDMRNQPVIYSVFSLAQDKEPETNKQHMIHQFETAVRLMPEGVEKWVWVMDFHGFGMADCNPRIAKIFLSMTSSHYPERLSSIVVLGAPSLFNGLWSMIKPLVPEVTKKKIRFVGCDVDTKTDGKDMRKGLEDIFGEELLEWMIAETRDTRQKVKQKIEKTYSLSDLDRLPEAGTHDNRGTASFVKMLSASPHLLTGHQSQQ